MPSGLVALLDDVAAITKLAAASLDDIGAAAGKAGAKAAGVVVDDAAVTPRYVAGLTPDRELPIIGKIALGSLRNKLLLLLPAALLLSALAPWAITPILMAGGAYLCFEGAEKLIEVLWPHDADAAVAHVSIDPAQLEREQVTGAIRTDLILSGEIMAIALAEIAAQPLLTQAVVLALVGIVITVGVYGVVALIVKMDDIGLRLARTGGALAGLGRGLVRGMPVLLKILGSVGTAAMIWVGGGIIVHGIEVFGVTGPAHLIHAAAVAIGRGSAVVEWIITAIGAGIVGTALGATIVGILHAARPKAHHA